jgi:hypothetical protein
MGNYRGALASIGLPVADHALHQTTTASYRTIPVAKSLLEALASHLAEWPADHEWGLVFTNTEGGPIQEHTFGSAWAVSRSKAAVPDWATPKALLHYSASVLIRGKASVKVVQVRLSHSSAKTTLDIYGYLFEDEEDKTRTTIETEFGAMTACGRPKAPVRGRRRHRTRRSSAYSVLDVVVEHEGSGPSDWTAADGRSGGQRLVTLLWRGLLGPRMRKF